MNWGYVFLIAFTFTVLLILAQRAEQGRRKWVNGFVVAMAILLMIRYEQQTENLIGYGMAFIASYLFWLLIGRYNPTGSSDSIKVYGIDD